MYRSTEDHREYKAYKKTSPMGTRVSWRPMVVPVAMAAGLLFATTTGPSASASSVSLPATHHGAGKGAGNASGAGGGLASGVTVKVEHVSGDRLTVVTKAGRTKTVLVGSKTVVTLHGAKSSVQAVRAGETVLVKGALNSSGDIVARSMAVQS